MFYGPGIRSVIIFPVKSRVSSGEWATCWWSSLPWTQTCSGVDAPRSRRFPPKPVGHHADTSIPHASEAALKVPRLFVAVGSIHDSKFRKAGWLFYLFIYLFANNRVCAGTPERNARCFECVNTDSVLNVQLFQQWNVKQKLLTRFKSGASETLHNTYRDSFENAQINSNN